MGTDQSSCYFQVRITTAAEDNTSVHSVAVLHADMLAALLWRPASIMKS